MSVLIMALKRDGKFLPPPPQIAAELVEPVETNGLGRTNGLRQAQASSPLNIEKIRVRG
jgi:hypothetical protein